MTFDDKHVSSEGLMVNGSAAQHQHRGNTYCQRFNIDDIEKGTTTIICGKKLNGKSTVLVTLIQNRLQKSNAQGTKVVIFASRYVVPSYRKYFRGDDIYEKYDRTTMKKLVDKQQESGGENELIVAIDDVAVNENIWDDVYIRDVVRYGSSLGITTIFCLQYAGQLDNVFKRNIDYVFIFHDHMIESQKLLYDEFGGMFPSFIDFKTVLDECIAEPYRCLVFDLKTPRKEPRHGVFWYKGPRLEQKFVPGPKKTWWNRFIDYLV